MIKGYKTKDWLVGFTSYNNKIYVLDKNKIESESSHKKECFEDVLKHEIAHLYYRAFKGNVYPNWLNEGTAAYVANQKYLLNYKYPIKISVLDNFHISKPNSESLMIGATMVNEIIKNGGKNELFRIIKINHKEERYKELLLKFPWLKD